MQRGLGTNGLKERSSSRRTEYDLLWPSLSQRCPVTPGRPCTALGDLLLPGLLGQTGVLQPARQCWEPPGCSQFLTQKAQAWPRQCSHASLLAAQISQGKMLHTGLTLLLELWLNSLKMYPTASHAEQLWALALSSSLMKCRTALLTCQGSTVVMIFLLRSQREATCSPGQPFRPA